jgi:hypothetical protein
MKHKSCSGFSSNLSPTLRIISRQEMLFLARCLAVDDSPVPDDWQGGLDVQYQTGPGFRESGWKLRMQVRTTNQRAKVHNVVGVLRGSIEPGL